MQIEWEIARELGSIRTLILEGQRQAQEGRQALHHRLDYQDQWLRFMIKRIDRPKNGNGSKIPYGKAALIGVLLIIGILGIQFPAATKQASFKLLERLLLNVVSG